MTAHDAQLGEIAHHHVSAGFAQRVAMSGPIHGDDQPEPTAAARFHTRKTILDDGRALVAGTQAPCGLAQDRGVGRSGEADLRRVDAVDRGVEEPAHAGRLQHGHAVAAR